MKTRLGVDVEALERDLREAVDGEVRFDHGTRATTPPTPPTTARCPIGVVVPRTSTPPWRAVAGVPRAISAPVLSRGGGTSLAGQARNVAVVIDWTKYCNRLVAVDAERRTCVVEPGIVLDDLNAPAGRTA